MDQGDDLMAHVKTVQSRDFRGRLRTIYCYDNGVVRVQSDSMDRLKEMVRDYKPPVEGTF